MVSTSRATRRRRVKRQRAAIGAAMVVLVALVVVRAWPTHHAVVVPECSASGAAGTYRLDLDQATNATTIATVGKSLGLPDHAVTVALAAAMQESELHDLAGGDRDSIGLFQQRPSQGWGTPAEVADPIYSATAFYRHLTRVADWQNRSVTDAAQAVQHSAAPDAYAAWESEARTVAAALTGEVPAGFTCHFDAAAATPAHTRLAQAMVREVGSPGLGAVVETPRGWLMANWLVGHAHLYGIGAVTFDGHRWTPASGTWTPTSPAVPQVEI